MSNKKKTQPAEVAEAEVKEQEVEETKVETTKKPDTTKKSTEEAKAAEPKMYVGPKIPGIGIQNRVYTEIPEGAASLIKEHPEFSNLFIAIEEYPKANRMLRERTGYIYSAFNKALGYKKINK